MAKPNPQEWLQNAALGASVLGWAFMGMWTADWDERFSIVRISITGLNLCVGCLFFARSAVSQHGSLPAILISLPSLVLAGFALRFSPPLASWPSYAAILFGLAAAWTIISFIYLGRSFAILPARRKIVIRGPYRLIRHPAYAGELVLLWACLIADPTWIASLPTLFAIPLLAARIIQEEKLLSQSPDYGQYKDKVRWRLLPGVW